MDAGWSFFVNWIIDKLWPWFVKNIWPEIRKRIEGLVRLVLDILFDKLFQFYKEWAAKWEKSAYSNAAAAEKKAEETTDPGEAEKYRAKADVWHEVAENFRQENEMLKKELESLKAETRADLEQKLDSMNIDRVIKEKDIRQKLKYMPSLPIPHRNMDTKSGSLEMKINLEKDTIREDCPEWTNPSQRDCWQKIGLVIWNNEYQKIINLSASQAIDLLNYLRTDDIWKRDGLAIGEQVVCLSQDPSNEKPKIVLSNQIQLNSEQAQELFTYLQQQEEFLQVMLEKDKDGEKQAAGF